jgi:hypothetical protein
MRGIDLQFEGGDWGGCTRIVINCIGHVPSVAPCSIEHAPFVASDLARTKYDICSNTHVHAPEIYTCWPVGGGGGGLDIHRNTKNRKKSWMLQFLS